MTSQDKTENKELIEQARALKIKGWHFYSIEALEKKVCEVLAAQLNKVDEPEEEAPVVAEVKVEAAPAPQQANGGQEQRRVVPAMRVANARMNDRERVAMEHRRAEPDCEFVYQHSSVSNETLAAKGLQRTDTLVGNDVLCRTTKESFVAAMREYNEAAYEVAKAVEKDNEAGQVVRRLTERRRS